MLKHIMTLETIKTIGKVIKFGKYSVAFVVPKLIASFMKLKPHSQLDIVYDIDKDILILSRT